MPKEWIDYTEDFKAKAGAYKKTEEKNRKGFDFKFKAEHGKSDEELLNMSPGQELEQKALRQKIRQKGEDDFKKDHYLTSEDEDNKILKRGEMLEKIAGKIEDINVLSGLARYLDYQDKIQKYHAGEEKDLELYQKARENMQKELYINDIIEETLKEEEKQNLGQYSQEQIELAKIIYDNRLGSLSSVDREGLEIWVRDKINISDEGEKLQTQYALNRYGSESATERIVLDYLKLQGYVGKESKRDIDEELYTRGRRELEEAVKKFRSQAKAPKVSKPATGKALKNDKPVRPEAAAGKKIEAIQTGADPEKKANKPGEAESNPKLTHIETLYVSELEKWQEHFKESHFQDFIREELPKRYAKAMFGTDDPSEKQINNARSILVQKVRGSDAGYILYGKFKQAREKQPKGNSGDEKSRGEKQPTVPPKNGRPELDIDALNRLRENFGYSAATQDDGGKGKTRESSSDQPNLAKVVRLMDQQNRKPKRRRIRKENVHKLAA